MLEKFSNALAVLYRQAQRTEPGLFRQGLLDQVRELVACDGGVLSVWQLSTSSHDSAPPERVCARICMLLQQAEPAQAQRHAAAFFSSLPSPQIVNDKHALRRHPLPWMQELHDDENLQKLMLLGDLGPQQGTARWIILFRCGARGFSPHDAAVLHAFWHHAMQAMDMNLDSALSRVETSGGERTAALVNSRGIIEIADERVKELLLQEWPMLRGAALPKTALASLLATACYRGKFIELRAFHKSGYLACTVEKVRAVTMLTPSEISAVQCFARGMTHSAIACRFGVSPHTVRNQLANAYRKLGVHSKAELIRVVAGF